MNPLEEIFDTPPDYTNDFGVKWWLDKSLTTYAKEKNFKGISLPNVQVFDVEEPNGNRTRLIIEDSKIIYENSGLEAIATYIDMMKVNKQFSDNNK